MRLENFDKNMTGTVVSESDGFEFRDIGAWPFRVYGVYRKDNEYRRIPADLAACLDPGMPSLSKQTAGGRVRFVTDSPRVAIDLVRGSTYTGGANLTFINVAGVALYVDGVYTGTYNPGGDFAIDKYRLSLSIPGERKKHLITLYLPLYGYVQDMLVGVEKGSYIGEAEDYKYEKPIVYYGSSITQGGCASRPGISYEALIERALDANYINLGFSGSAKAEDAMAEYVANLDMSVFVYDYDYNAPNPEHLLGTHEKMFLKIREKHPHLPVVMVTRPRAREDADRNKRREIIKATYDRAIAGGDKNVYLIYGSDLFEGLEYEYTVDDCHPTDLGFWFMAKGITPIIKKILENL